MTVWSLRIGDPAMFILMFICALLILHMRCRDCQPTQVLTPFSYPTFFVSKISNAKEQ